MVTAAGLAEAAFCATSSWCGFVQAVALWTQRVTDLGVEEDVGDGHEDGVFIVASVLIERADGAAPEPFFGQA